MVCAWALKLAIVSRAWSAPEPNAAPPTANEPIAKLGIGSPARKTCRPAGSGWLTGSEVAKKHCVKRWPEMMSPSSLATDTALCGASTGFIRAIVLRACAALIGPAT